MNTIQQSVRRVVTGHDAEGKAIILSDAPSSRTYMVGGPHGAKFHEIWHTLQTPALIEQRTNDNYENQLVLSPSYKGTRIRVIDFPVETEEIRNLIQQKSEEHFKSMRGEQAFSGQKSDGNKFSAHPLMHRTETIDYGIVLEGELTLILDETEINLKSGDIVIQCGTNHAWTNRSDKVCRVAFILISGKYDEILANNFSRSKNLKNYASRTHYPGKI